MAALMPLINQLICGAVGSNVIAALLKKFSLGIIDNSIKGLVDAGLSSQFLGSMIGGGTGGEVAAAGAGGGVLMIIIGLIKSAMSKYVFYVFAGR